MIKGLRRQPPPEKKPREGTRLRAAFDYFRENKGVAVVWNTDKRQGWNELSQLREYYGFDLRLVKVDPNPAVRGRWLLAGEYIGRDYVSYMDGSKTRVDEMGLVVAQGGAHVWKTRADYMKPRSGG
jgi:hypothetical protein